MIVEYNTDVRYHGVWTGGYNVDGTRSWYWEHNNAPVVSDNWRRGQPNNRAPREPCIETGRGAGGEWNDVSCSLTQPFICELDVV